MDEIKELQAANAEHLLRWDRSRTEKTPDPALFEHEYKQFQERSSKVTDLLSRHTQRNPELFKKKMQLTEKCVEATSQISELLSPVVGSMRAELGLPFDALVFSKLVREAQAKGMEDMQSFLNAIHSIVDDHVGLSEDPTSH